MLLINELIVQILGIVIPVISSIIGWFLAQNQNIFNLRKIQKYDVWDYQYTVFLYQAFYSVINPIIFLVGFFFAVWVSAKIEYSYYLQLVFSMEIYIILLVVVLIIESEVLGNKRKRLDIISSSISEEASELMLNIDKKKELPYKISTFIFFIIWVLSIFTSNQDIMFILILFWIISYFILIIYMFRRLSKYKTKAKIKSNTIIRMDYRKDYRCYCNIVLKKEFSFKVLDNNIIIYYPGDISSYTIKQDNLISITVGYKIEYTENNKN